jgi:hypothetical protein
MKILISIELTYTYFKCGIGSQKRIHAFYIKEKLGDKSPLKINSTFPPST